MAQYKNFIVDNCVDNCETSVKLLRILETHNPGIVDNYNRGYVYGSANDLINTIIKTVL